MVNNKVATERRARIMSSFNRGGYLSFRQINGEDCRITFLTGVRADEATGRFLVSTDSKQANRYKPSDVPVLRSPQLAIDSLVGSMQFVVDTSYAETLVNKDQAAFNAAFSFLQEKFPEYSLDGHKYGVPITAAMLGVTINAPALPLEREHNDCLSPDWFTYKHADKRHSKSTFVDLQKRYPKECSVLFSAKGVTELGAEFIEQAVRMADKVYLTKNGENCSMLHRSLELLDQDKRSHNSHLEHWQNDLTKAYDVILKFGNTDFFKSVFPKYVDGWRKHNNQFDRTKLDL